MSELTFSIIIPAFNEANSIARCIRSIQQNDFPAERYDITVMDNGSTDETVCRAGNCGAKVIECGRTGTISAMRNRGAVATLGEVLVFIDADMIIPENLFKIAANLFSSRFQGAMGFVDDVPENANWVGRVWGGVHKLKRPKLMAVDSLPGRNIFVNRRAFEAIGGFDETLTTAEDKDFCLRLVQAGYRVVSIPKPTPIHLGCERGLHDFIKKEYWRQKSAFPMACRHGYSFRTLRNPLLGAWHLIWGLLTVLCAIFSGYKWQVMPLLFAWILPAAVIAVKTVGVRRLLFLAQFFFLTFLRWNVAGVSLLGVMLKHMRKHRSETVQTGNTRSYRKPQAADTGSKTLNRQ